MVLQSLGQIINTDISPHFQRVGKFFTVTSIGLVIVAAGVLSHGVGDLEGAFNKHPAIAFDVHRFIGTDSVLGHLLSGTVGFSPVTTILQAVAWTVYLVVVLSLYLRKPGRRPSPISAQVKTP